MPYCIIGDRISIYAIREQTGNRQDPNDPYVFIGFSNRKRLYNYLYYFTNEVTENDSLTHQAVRAYIENNPNNARKFYVRLISRKYYHPVRTRNQVVNLQNLHNVIIPYP